MLNVCVVGRERERDQGVGRKPKPWHRPSHDTGAAALPAPRPAPRAPGPITLLLSIVCCVWEGSGGRCTLYHTCQQARLAQTCVHVDAHSQADSAGVCNTIQRENWVILARYKDSGADSGSWNGPRRNWQCHITNSRTLGAVMGIPVTALWKSLCITQITLTLGNGSLLLKLLLKVASPLRLQISSLFSIAHQACGQSCVSCLYETMFQFCD